MVWKWIPKRNLTSTPNEAPIALEDNQQLASPYKKALLRNLNINKLEAPNGNLAVVGNDVHQGLLDNSKTINQPLMMLIIIPFLLESSLLRHQVADPLWKTMRRLTVLPRVHLIVPSRWTLNFMKRGRWLNILTKERRVGTETSG